MTTYVLPDGREVREIDGQGIVLIGGSAFVGQIDDEMSRCCDVLRIYHDICDAYFCPACDTWLETKCLDPACQYCRNRPEKPLPA